VIINDGDVDCDDSWVTDRSLIVKSEIARKLDLFERDDLSISRSAFQTSDIEPSEIPFGSAKFQDLSAALCAGQSGDNSAGLNSNLET
jgi:hypothetical protein